jgi:hypothetical protein
LLLNYLIRMTASASRPGGFSLWRYKMEAFRQMLSTVYIALAEAAGEGALEDANKIITNAIDCGSVDDVYARSALRALVRASSKVGV